jgi:molybdopterin-guanine dinucleotide biosynthesis protein A
MGRDKALLRLGSKTLLQHVRAGARATGLGVRVVRKDLMPACGPLGGLYTALKTTQCDVVLALACDMPFVSPELLKGLLKKFGRRRKSMFVSHGGRPGFPLLLHRATLPEVAGNIERRRLALHELAASLKSSVVRLRVGAHELWNVNTPEEFVIAEAWWAGQRKLRVIGKAG